MAGKEEVQPDKTPTPGVGFFLTSNNLAITILTIDVGRLTVWRSRQQRKMDDPMRHASYNHREDEDGSIASATEALLEKQPELFQGSPAPERWEYPLTLAALVHLSFLLSLAVIWYIIASVFSPHHPYGVNLIYS
jgi:hypothetical protein